MADCDICGAPADTKATVEGAVLNVCRKCVSYGKELVALRPAAKPVFRPAGPKEVYVVEGAGKLIQQAREREKLSVYDLAHEIFVNVDYLKQIEAGKRVPDEKTAKKIGGRLRITLVSDKPAGE